MISDNNLKNFSLKFGNDVELFKGFERYKKGEFCLDKLDEGYAVMVCPCRAHRCLQKCCPFGQYYNTKQQHCLKSTSLKESVLKALIKVNPSNFRLVNPHPLKCGDEPDWLIKSFDDPTELMVDGKGYLVLQLEGQSTLIETKRWYGGQKKNRKKSVQVTVTVLTGFPLVPQVTSMGSTVQPLESVLALQISRQPSQTPPTLST